MGIVRPQMLQKLIAIRNAVEHEDADPPALEACEVFLEFVWYFLKSTDRMVQVVPDEIFFEERGEKPQSWAEVKVRPPDMWTPSIRGWFSPDFVSDKPKDQWISLKIERSEKPTASPPKANSRAADVVKVESFGSDRDPDDRYLVGEMRGPGEALKRFYRLYFELT